MSNNMAPKFISVVIIAVLVSAVTALAMQSGASSMDKKELQDQIAEFIIANPEVVVSAFDRAQELEEQKRQEAAKKAIDAKKGDLENDPESPMIGNPEGDVALVEFFDYNCGYCKRVVPDIIKLVEEDSNIKVVFKEMPIFGGASTTAAKASLAVYYLDKAKYIDFHAALMKANARNEEQIFATAENTGIDVAALKKEMESERVNNQMTKTAGLFREIGLRGTPGFVIGGTLVPGAIGLDEMKRLVAEARGS